MKIVGLGAKYSECIRGQLVLSNAEGVPNRYFLDLVPWIGEQRYIEMLVLHFSNNPEIYGYVGKFLE